MNPSTRVGVSKLKEAIRNTRLENFGYKLDDMISNVESNYNQIIERGHKHDDIVMDFFYALLSTKNSVFKDFIQRKKDQWEDGTDMTLDELSASALSKYNNMVEQRTWNEKDPKDAKIIALATQVETLRSQIGSNTYKNNGGSATNTSHNSHPGQQKKRTNMPEWRMKKKGPMKIVDGVE